MEGDRGAAALAERLHLHYEHTDLGPWPHDHPISPIHRDSAHAILGEHGEFLPDGLPLFVMQMAAEIERVWEQRELAETEADRLAEQLENADARLAEREEEIERLREVLNRSTACEEPGCMRQRTRRVETPNGYRWVCGDHYGLAGEAER